MWILDKEIKRNPLPAAIIIVESNFRPFLIRILEYFYFYICLYLRKERAMRISLGISQMQYRFWLEYFDYSYSNSKISKCFEDPLINYNLVEWYINKYHYENLLDVSQVYTGKKNIYYSKKLLEVINQLKVG
ncbi:hypothetical protein [Paenibacillus glucanolyticus]|uniref:hypothetical protein n=1 Tax=Paenibacillus TaxID=44249 RepID=UPI0007B40BBD|nr:hypothetical protein [Paenibacillus glucanolyticus]ANA82326.1 hypothetical protein A3958_21150 [Paenibacillus glucanolyticus]MPY17097.1 hypothetical protein [Paenibacillus glucanolyticus]